MFVFFDLDIPEAAEQIHRHVPVVFLKAVILSDEVEVVSADEWSSAFHLCHHTKQNPPSDGDMTRKGAFLVSIGALIGLLGHLEAQTDVFVVSQELLLASFSKQDALLILKGGWLLLVGTLSLNVCHLPSCLKKL